MPQRLHMILGGGEFFGMTLTLDQARANHSQSPNTAEDGAVIDAEIKISVALICLERSETNSAASPLTLAGQAVSA
jgi:hypothetical protein